MISVVIGLLALASYSIGIITQQKIHRISRRILFFISLGLVFDLAATLLVILGPSEGYFSLQRITGYTALIAMMIATLLLWRLKFNAGWDAAVPRNLHLFTRYAFILCVLTTETDGLF